MLLCHFLEIASHYVATVENWGSIVFPMVRNSTNDSAVNLVNVCLHAGSARTPDDDFGRQNQLTWLSGVIPQDAIDQHFAYAPAHFPFRLLYNRHEWIQLGPNAKIIHTRQGNIFGNAQTTFAQCIGAARRNAGTKGEEGVGHCLVDQVVRHVVPITRAPPFKQNKTIRLQPG